MRQHDHDMSYHDEERLEVVEYVEQTKRPSANCSLSVVTEQEEERHIDGGRDDGDGDVRRVGNVTGDDGNDEGWKTCCYSCVCVCAETVCDTCRRRRLKKWKGRENDDGKEKASSLGKGF